MDISLELTNTAVNSDTGNKATIGQFISGQILNVTDVSPDLNSRKILRDIKQKNKENKIKHDRKRKNKEENTKQKQLKQNSKDKNISLFDVNETTTGNDDGKEADFTSTTTVIDSSSTSSTPDSTSANIVQGSTMSINGIKILSPDYVRNFIQNQMKELQANNSTVQTPGRPPESTAFTVAQTSSVASTSVKSIKPEETGKWIVTETTETSNNENFTTVQNVNIFSTTSLDSVQENATTNPNISTENNLISTRRISTAGISTSTTTVSKPHETVSEINDQNDRETKTTSALTVADASFHADDTGSSRTIAAAINVNPEIQSTVTLPSRTTHSHTHEINPFDENDSNLTSVEIRRGTVIIDEDDDSVDAKDIDIIIFPSERLNKRKRKQQRRKFCAKIGKFTPHGPLATR